MAVLQQSKSVIVIFCIPATTTASIQLFLNGLWVSLWQMTVLLLSSLLHLLRIFGFVARKTGTSMDNICHLFAEHDPEQPASAIVNFVSKVMIGSQKSK